MDNLKQMIKDTIEKLNLKVSDKEKAQFQEIMEKIYIEKQKPKDVLGFSDEMMEHMYAYGYRLYNNGSYKKAGDVFLGLTAYDPTEARYNLAVGAAYHRQKNYREAAKYYLRAATTSTLDPLPFYYLYDCYIQGGMLGDAMVCLENVIHRSESEPAFAKMKERSQMLLDNLKVEIDRLEKAGEMEDDTTEEIGEEEIPQELMEVVQQANSKQKNETKKEAGTPEQTPKLKENKLVAQGDKNK